MKEKAAKVGRNDPCPCGSGLKYKRCCMGKGKSDALDLATLYARKYNIRLKQKADVEGIRKAGRLVLEALDLVESKIQPGLVTEGCSEGGRGLADTGLVDGVTTNFLFLQLDTEVVSALHDLQYPARGSVDLGADSVAGDEDDLMRCHMLLRAQE